MNNLLLRRRMLMQAGGSPTPPTMVDVEYLISNVAYIDTGIVPDSNYTIECEFAFNTTSNPTSNDFVVFGSGVSYNSRNIELYNANDNFTVTYSGYNNRGTAKPACFYKIVQVGGNVTIYNENGTTNTTYDYGAKSFTCPYSMYLFALHRASIFMSAKDVAIRLFKMWDGDGNLIVNYTPKRVNGVGYFYDSVSNNIFGSANANALIIGNDKNSEPPLPTFILPSGYTQYDYLESDGTQYFDTGVGNGAYANDIVLQTETLFRPATAAYVWNFFANTNAGYYGLQKVGPNDGVISLNTGVAQSNLYQYNYTHNDLIHLYFCEGLCNMEINDVLYQQLIPHTQLTDNLRFFYAGSNKSKGALTQTPIYIGGTLVRNFVPCTDDNGVACMRDTVNGVDYYGDNSSGNAFIVGNF